jgi:16S rRNA (uracil1498-N3)-methyltransferase
MSSPRFFVNKIAGSKASVTGEDYDHIVSVLRLGRGAEINVFNPEHGEFKAVILSVDAAGREIRLEVGDLVRGREKTGTRLAAAIAVIKKDNMELVLEKLTEIGVDEIIPVVTKRSVVRIKDGEKKSGRWEKIIYSAVKQSGRVSPPALHKTFYSVEELAAEAADGPRFLVWEKEEKNLLIDEALRARDAERALFFIGPEGGFEQSEAEYLMGRGFIPVSMGSTTLRSETAAILAGGILAQALWRGKWKS